MSAALIKRDHLNKSLHEYTHEFHSSYSNWNDDISIIKAAAYLRAIKYETSLCRLPLSLISPIFPYFIPLNKALKPKIRVCKR
jgi:hypothetical protein